MKTMIMLLALTATFRSFSQEMLGPVEKKQKEEIHSVVDQMPEFPGGNAGLEKYMASNLRYPLVAQELGVQGKCFLKFVVSSEGKVRDVSVERGVKDCPECDNEAVRVVRGMPDWKPAKLDGKSVSCYFFLPVQFKLESE